MPFFKKVSFRRKLDFWVIYVERYLIKVVRMDHTDHFCEISLQISEPKIEFSTKTHFLKNGHVQILGNTLFGEKKGMRGGSTAKQRL